MPQNINLIDPALLPAPQRLSPPRLLGLLAGAAVLVLGHWGHERLRLARALAQATQGAPTEQATQDLAQDGQALERLAQREALRDLLRNEVAIPNGSAPLIATLLRALPPTVWLTELELGPQRKLRISGGTLDTAGFGQLAAALNDTTAMRGLPLHVVRLEPQPAPPQQQGEDAPTAAPDAQLFVLEGSPAAETPATGSRP